MSALLPMNQKHEIFARRLAMAEDRKHRTNPNEKTHDQLAQDIQSFLANGGSIKKCTAKDNVMAAPITHPPSYYENRRFGCIKDYIAPPLRKYSATRAAATAANSYSQPFLDVFGTT